MEKALVMICLQHQERFGGRESLESSVSREVGLYVDQRDDMVMKPRRPYFSSADKAEFSPGTSCLPLTGKGCLSMFKV